MSNKRYLLMSPPLPKIISQTSNKSVGNIAMFPVGLAYISSSMKLAGFDVLTLNGSFAEPDLEAQLTRLIKTDGVDVVCIGGQSIDVHGILRVIEIVRRIDPKVTIVTGGAIISADAVTAMEVLMADIGIIGEGEEAMCDLAHALNNDVQLSLVPGTIYWENGQLRKAPTRTEVQNLDALPYMDFDGFAYRQWLELNNNTGIIFTARSCPFKCTFCFKSTGDQYRSRSMDSVFAEIDYQIEHYGITTLNVSDELFAAKKQRVIDFCERIRPYKLSWGCSLRVPEIVEELLPLMKEAGCTTIGTGLESASPEILLSMRKKIKLNQVEKALKTFGDTGMVMLANLIFGDANETRETYKESIDFWHQHKDNIHINLGTINALPGTRLYEDACAKGIIADKRQYLLEGTFIVNVSKLSHDEYYEMLSEIIELSYLPQVPASKVSISEHFGDGLCSVEWTCRRCGTRHEDYRMHFLQADIVHCPCGVQNTIEPFRDVIAPTDVLAECFPTNRNYAFWGVGSQYHRLSRFFGDDLKGDHFIQVDANEHHQKMTRLGKKIFPPSVIREQGISDVIITSPLARSAIMTAIESDFTDVKRVHFPVLLSTNGQFRCSFETTLLPVRT